MFSRKIMMGVIITLILSMSVVGCLAIDDQDNSDADVYTDTVIIGGVDQPLLQVSGTLSFSSADLDEYRMYMVESCELTFDTSQTSTGSSSLYGISGDGFAITTGSEIDCVCTVNYSFSGIPTTAGIFYANFLVTYDAIDVAADISVIKTELLTITFDIQGIPVEDTDPDGYDHFILYNCTGGYGSIDAGLNTSDLETDVVIITSSIPTRLEYTFLGWSESSTATTVSYVAGDSITVTSSGITLYAVWSFNVVNYYHTIQYYPNGGSDDVADQIETSTGSTLNMTVTSVTLTREGYPFFGWSLSEAATTVSYVAGDVISVGPDEIIKLYAVWSVESDPDEPSTVTDETTRNGIVGLIVIVLSFLAILYVIITIYRRRH
jgi:uncharacterized repeat protein (TIGR02543 family)